ncbi:type II methionyl aminopeptidase [Candidatus Woesearchaeota archaeon]|nr:type II methionyl aminopeptidase [Candidatus Woesearchaeota archaeon]
MADYNDWLRSGSIASKAREYSKTLIKPGAKLLDVADRIEAKIRELGAEPGFPVNISLNEIAAHYTPVPDDELVFSDQVVKIDIGTSVNGAIGDTAYTIDLSGRYSELVKASNEALSNVIKILQIGTTLGEIGKTIQETIESYGFRPVKNLSGHGLDRFEVHTAPSIPNYNTNDPTELKKGMTIAIEPFATDGAGLIKDSSTPVIFSQTGSNPVRDFTARKVLKDISAFNELPFATRWLTQKYTEPRLKLAFRSLTQAGNLTSYPPLVEINKGMVSQAEHSFIIEDKVITTT